MTRPSPVKVTSKAADPPGPTPGTTGGVNDTDRPAGTPEKVRETSRGRVAAVVTAATIASRIGPGPPVMLNTSGLPVASVAPVSSARADSDTLGSKFGPTGLRMATPPGARPITETPRALSAATVSGTVAAPRGATAAATVLPVLETELLTKPNLLEPAGVEQRSAVVGTVAPPAPVIVGGTGTPAVNAATGQMSPALMTRRSAPGRKPTPPRVPEAGATFEEKGGTSPLTPGLVWGFVPGPAKPAGPLSSSDPFPLPSNPLPVAICLSASMLLSGPSPPKPGAVRLSAPLMSAVKLGMSGVMSGWFRVNGRPVVFSLLKLAPGPP